MPIIPNLLYKIENQKANEECRLQTLTFSGSPVHVITADALRPTEDLEGGASRSHVMVARHAIGSEENGRGMDTTTNSDFPTHFTTLAYYSDDDSAFSNITTAAYMVPKYGSPGGQRRSAPTASDADQPSDHERLKEDDGKSLAESSLRWNSQAGADDDRERSNFSMKEQHFLPPTSKLKSPSFYQPSSSSSSPGKKGKKRRRYRRTTTTTTTSTELTTIGWCSLNVTHRW